MWNETYMIAVVERSLGDEENGDRNGTMSSLLIGCESQPVGVILP